MKLRDLNEWKRAKALPLIIATDGRAAALGAQMVRDGRAYGCVYVDDHPSGAVDVQYIVGADHAHRMPEIVAMIEKVADKLGGVAVDGARFVRGGEA